MFFNEKVLGDYVILSVNKNDVEEVNYALQKNIQNELLESINEIYKKASNELRNLNFKETDFVELLVDKKEYNNKNIFKGEKGVIVNEQVRNNKIMVDFTGVDEEGKLYGDIILVDIADLKKI